MNLQRTIALELTSFLLLGAMVGAFFAFYMSYKPLPHIRVVVPIPQDTPTSIPSPTPTELPKPQTTTQLSPDGNKQLTMTVTTNADLSKSYAFSTAEADGTNEKTVYSVTKTQDSLSIPFNTWSPDDNYVFVTDTTSSGTEAIVMKASGDPISNTDSSINVTDVFNTKNKSDNVYYETTGWASDTLLIILTKTPEGKEGTSYWFEVPTQAVIPLTTQF